MAISSRLLLILLVCPLCRALLVPSFSLKRSSYGQQLSASLSDNDDDEEPDDPTTAPSTLDVIQQCMGKSSSLEPDGLIVRSTKPGISGFSVDSELGFVAVLTNQNNYQSTFCVVSPLDTSEVCSPEALCMVQMSGGMDLATTVLPPDILARLVADELELSSEGIRAHVELLEVHAVDNEESQGNSNDDSSSGKATAVPSSPERDEKLSTDVAKFMLSIKNLPGLSTCTEDNVLEALKLHADEDGNLDRTGFTAVLDTLRRGGNSRKHDKVRFEILVALDDETHRIPVPSTVHALGLSMRYEKEVQVDVSDMELDSLEILSRFPNFRPIQELEEDARLMDGFIPSMYGKATAPKADDRS